jgi:hypothetical protein
VNQELNQALTEAAQDPQTQGYCQEILDILAARQRGDLSREEAEYLLREMAEVRVAQNTAATEQAVRWTVQAIGLAARLI